MTLKHSQSLSVGFRSWAVLAACWILVATPLAACGPYPIDAAFWHPHHSGESWGRLVTGELGILVPGLGPQELFVAYRHLAGSEGGGVPSTPLLALRPPPSGSTEPDAQTLWLSTRQNVPDVPAIRWIGVHRQEKIERSNSVSYQSNLNCLDHAFRHAATTLQERIERFGATSLGVKSWVAAQDMVFRNCESGKHIPEPLGPVWDPLLRADRTYQIAAAHFYAGDLHQAARLFAAIAVDQNSPWQPLSAYLVARTQLRNRDHHAAEAQLSTVLETPSFAPLHPAARDLLAWSRAQSAPAERSAELAAKLRAPSLNGETLQRTFLDFLHLRSWVSADDPLGAWFRAMFSPEMSQTIWNETFRRWQQEGDLPSLLAALAGAPATAPDELLAAALQVPPAARFSALFHRARILLERGDHLDARQALDTLLAEAADKLPVGDLNRVRLLRAQAGTELEEYLTFQFVRAVAVGWDLGGGSIHPLPDDEVTAALGPLHQVLADDAVELINHGLDLQEMAELTTRFTLPPRWRKRLARATWTRAVLLRDFDLALSLAPQVAEQNPELAAEMAALGAAEEAEQPFVTALTLLRFPGLAPVLRSDMGRRTALDEIDSNRDNGWCAGVLRPVPLKRQRVRSPERLQEVAATFPKTGLDASPNVLGVVVLDRAASHPDDPRVPEALHRVVKATRYGCRFQGFGEISKAAFERLQKIYPASSWTEKTPHWFD